MTVISDLPQAWLEQFDGVNLDRKLHVAALLGTLDEEGWPHIAYLSAGEVLARDARRVTLALWPGSRSAVNLARFSRGALHAAADGAVWEVKLLVRLRDVAGAKISDFAMFDGEVTEVRRHAAPYAQVTGLIGFRLNDPVATLDRWRRQIERMRVAA